MITYRVAAAVLPDLRPLMLAGYRHHDGKLYELTDRQVAVRRATSGMVFQRFNLFGHMTALENIIEAPVRVKRIPKPEAKELAGALMAQVVSGEHRAGPDDDGDAYARQVLGSFVAVGVAVGRRFAGGAEAYELGHVGRYVGQAGRIAGVVISYVLEPDGDATRLLMKLAAPNGSLVALPLCVGDLVMARRQLLSLKRLAEQPAAMPTV